jgi:C1A family cysteine protease
MKQLKTLSVILILIFGAQLLYGQTENNQDFKMVAKDLVTISINQSLSGTSELFPFDGKVREIYGLDLTADITLKSDKSLVRVILVDQNYEEYLVYEMYPLLTADQVVPVKKICEETALLNSVKPKSLRVEIQDAVVTLYTINCAGSIDIGMDVLKVKKEKLLAQNGEKIKGLNKNLISKGLSWVAGRTSVSDLTYSERKKLYGDSKFPPGFEFYVGGVIQAGNNMKPAPESLMVSRWDWRSRHGQNWVTGVKSQIGCGSCWAFAATGATEALVNLYFNQPLYMDLSEQDVVSCSGAGSCSGGSPYGALNYIMKTGIVDEEAFPYMKADLPCTDKNPYPSQLIKTGGVMLIGTKTYPKTEDGLKKMIIKYGPVSGAVADWNHAMTLVGWQVVKEGDYFYYRDLNKVTQWITVPAGSSLIGKTVWLFKNSWSDTFGDGGYVYVESAMTNLYAYAPLTPLQSLIQNYSVTCRDTDGDGYCWWGVGTKPVDCPPCPDQPDGDDSNAGLGPLDEYGNCFANPEGNCPASALSATNEWISKVQIGTWYNTSWNSGYSDYTDLTVNLVNGSNPVTLTPGFNRQSQYEYWRIWIDFDKDLNFADNGEEVFAANKMKTPVSGNMIIPAGSIGPMRMRVAMKRGSAPAPCGSFSYGEVEDYTVTMMTGSSQKSGTIAGLSDMEVFKSNLKIFPNPVSRELTIQVNSIPDQNELAIYSMEGKLLYKERLTSDLTLIDISKWDSGIYLVRFTCGEYIANRKFVKN